MRGWIKLEKNWLRVSNVRNINTGKTLQWSHTHLIIYLYLRDRYLYFKRQGTDFFDNQDVLAKDIGIPVRTLKRRLKEFSEAGIIKINKKHLRGHTSSNSYVILDIFTFSLFEVILDDGTRLDKEQKSIDTHKRVVKQVSYYEEDGKEPF